MPGTGKTTSSVLDRDGSLLFPHALLISASAGSGKTYTLAQRYVQFLLSDKVPNNGLSGILAVTFTNNAAKEMKKRILAWLKELALDKNCAKMDETLALVSLSREEIHRRAGDLVESVINDYSDFHIQTIDSFLARVMGASADELKLPPGAGIIMSYEALIDLALYSMFARIGAGGLPGEAVDKFLAVLPKSGAYPWNPAQRVKENFDSFLAQEGRAAGTLCAPPAGGEAAVMAKFKEAAEFCSGLIKRFGPELVKPRAASALAAGSPVNLLAEYSFKYGIFNGVKKGKFPANWEKDIAHLSALMTELAELNAEAYYQPYVGIYARFKEELERAKRGKTDVVHISDIARKLADYMSGERVPEIYLRLGERISHFLIDEFQDTNRLQWTVMRPLVEEALSKNGSLFVVGDIKQAIYMFRNADYRIMRDLLDKAEGKKAEAENLDLAPLDGVLKYANLPVNYRSDGAVLSYVDSIFKIRLKNSPDLIGQDITGLSTYEQRPLPGRVKDGYVRTEVLELESFEEAGAQKEALIKALRGAAARYPLNEIAILVEKNKRIEPVVEWLTEAGIPVASLSSLDIRKRKVVAELLSFLKFLETPSDDLAFADFITGDIFAKLTGLERGALQLFILGVRCPAAGKQGGLLYAAFRNHPAYRQYWDDYLDGAFRKVGYLPLYELLSLVYSSLRVFGNFPGEQAFLSRLLEAASALAAEGVAGPRGFLEHACGGSDEKAALFSIALPEYIDAVRVMTFHKSKGLGFSVVINLIYDERGMTDPMYFEERGGEIHVYHITKDVAEVSAKLRPIYAARKADAAVQDLNVLYVVATRARHELYNLVVKKIRKAQNGEPKLLEIFENCEAGTPAAHTPEHEEPALPVLISTAPERRERRFDALTPTYAAFAGTAEGELVHALLALYDGAGAAGPEARLDELYEACAPQFAFTSDKAGVLRRLGAFLAGAGAELFAAAPGREVLAEAEFIDRSGSLFRMDRVLVDKERVTVIDFKTGAANTEKYAAQLRNYIAILSEVYKRPARGVLAYVDLNRAEEIKA